MWRVNATLVQDFCLFRLFLMGGKELILPLPSLPLECFRECIWQCANQQPRGRVAQSSEEGGWEGSPKYLRDRGDLQEGEGFHWSVHCTAGCRVCTTPATMTSHPERSQNRWTETQIFHPRYFSTRLCIWCISSHKLVNSRTLSLYLLLCCQ